MNRTLAVVLVLAVVGCAIVVFAQGGGGNAPVAPGGPGGPGGPGAMMGGTCPAMAIAPPQPPMIERAQNLQLSEDQKTRLIALLVKSEQDVVALRNKAAQATRVLRMSIFSAECDNAKLAELAADAQKAEGAVLASELKTWGEIKTILSAQQLAELQKMMGRRMMGGPRGGPGGGGGFGGPPPPNGGVEPPPPPPGQ